MSSHSYDSESESEMTVVERDGPGCFRILLDPPQDGVWIKARHPVEVER